MRLRLLSLAFALAAHSVSADTLSFDKTWREQRFFQLFTNDYGLRGDALDIVSDGTVSLLWRLTPDWALGAGEARWNWAVREGVGPTDLTVKKGEDRNIALYFVFADAEAVDLSRRGKLRAFLMHPSTRVISYVWGGGVPRGTVLESPWNENARIIVLRPAGTGAHRERVDLAADFARAFGFEPGLLAGVAVSADSDDTDGRIVARIEGLALE